jgi:tRNA(Ile)-lysidine synthase
VRGLAARAEAVLSRRLRANHDRPLAVALSGGGDSLFLLRTADNWARRSGRPLVVLSVDHALQPDSAAWLDQCAGVAARLGRSFIPLRWTGEKPSHGLPAAARRARHRLLADATRAAGASVVLLGHTADDVLEAQVMRAAGSTTPDPREWAPSPAWPQGRGVFLLRPLLGLRRADIRAALQLAGETWIDDPANDDRRYARARARQSNPQGVAEIAGDAPLALVADAREALGAITLPRGRFRQASDVEAARFLSLAAVCAGGRDHLPRATQVDLLTTRLRSAEPLVATLAGARITASADEVAIHREHGEARRGGLAPIRTVNGDAMVWDGRFLICAAIGEVRPLHGLMKRLPRNQAADLARIPGPMRSGLPALICGEAASCLALDGRAQSLVGARLTAAAGLVDREPD